MKLTAVWTGISSESTTTKLIAQIIKAAVEHAAAFGEKLTVDRINLRDYTKKLALSALTPVPDSELEAAFKSVQTADAVVTISPIYKGAPIGIQTLFWQLIDDAALSGKPVLIGATGGTARHSLAAEYAIRPMLSYLKGIVLPSSIFAATDDWGSATGAAALQRRIDGTAKELVTALIGSKANHSPANTESSAADTAEAQDVKNYSQKSAAAADTISSEPENPEQIKEARERNNDTIELINKDLYTDGTKFPKRKSVTADLFDPNQITPFAQLLNRH